MNVNLVCPFIVVENQANPNIRKNNVKTFKLLVDSNGELVKMKIDIATTLKEMLKEKLSTIIGSNNFHLEQVYTLGEDKYYLDNEIDIIHLGITNSENIKKLSKDYKLVDFNVSNNVIIFDENRYEFETIEKVSNNNIEYFHEIGANDIKLEKKLLEVLIAYKQLRSKLDNSDIIFKFLPKYFTLEDVRMIYEMIKEVNVDKSNFRKRIVKYCVETDKDIVKRGYRPSRMYTFKVVKGDIWL